MTKTIYRCTCCNTFRACDCEPPWCDHCDRCLKHCKCKVIDGVGPEAPTVTNNQGGRQAKLPYACHLLPFKAVMKTSKVLKSGADKYGVDNWRSIPKVEHINHALAHIFAFGAGDRQDDHLTHAACRILFAMETE